MNFSLKDIMDLDFFLGLDEGREDDHQEDIVARDRDIYKQINPSGDKHKEDGSLILAWLEYRRLLCFQGVETGNVDRLPGTLYTSLYQWAVRGMIILGLCFGFLTAYSFLAYHGNRPVNVTLFIAFFILFQGGLSLVAGTIMVRWMRSGGSRGFRFSAFHTLIFGAFIKKLNALVKKAGDLPGGKFLNSSGESFVLDRFKSGIYKGLLFWPFFILTCLGGLCFSLGALGGTLFRVMVTDLAFGWQSTLFTSGEQIHRMVSGLALPWSWLLPDGAALPNLVQIEGSRIILKQGIMGLATENLTAWWPFLCVGILVYGIVPRLVLAAGAAGAGKKALASFDFNRPRYKRLIMRMRSPRMDTDIRETGGTRVCERAPLPDPVLCPKNEIAPTQSETLIQPNPSHATAAPVLASARVYPDGAIQEITQVLDSQLGIALSNITRVCFDFDEDREVLPDFGPKSGTGPVIILQEVRQPPIRGLLYYFKQIREFFPDHDLWIFLTRTPGEGDMGVEKQDMDYKVWETAVAQLNDPGIILERWRP